ncbi:MAG TPA: hypothetical protein VK009_05190 [Chloroflexota bacterium]|nr:hypothetical protein [Chloroflexota bacterium]
MTDDDLASGGVDTLQACRKLRQRNAVQTLKQVDGREQLCLIEADDLAYRGTAPKLTMAYRNTTSCPRVSGLFGYGRLPTTCTVVGELVARAQTRPSGAGYVPVAVVRRPACLPLSDARALARGNLFQCLAGAADRPL